MSIIAQLGQNIKVKEANSSLIPTDLPVGDENGQSFLNLLNEMQGNTEASLQTAVEQEDVLVENIDDSELSSLLNELAPQETKSEFVQQISNPEMVASSSSEEAVYTELINKDLPQPQENLPQSGEDELASILNKPSSEKSVLKNESANESAVDELLKTNPETDVVLKVENAKKLENTQQVQQTTNLQNEIPVNIKREPSIVFDDNLVDPQLVNFEDFVAQKNAVKNKIPSQAGYGQPVKKGIFENTVPVSNQDLVIAKPQQNDLVLNSLNKESITTSSAPLATLAGVGMAMMPKEDFSSFVAQGQEVKVLRMDQNQSVEKLIQDVSDYIAQVKTAKEPTVQLKVMHDELGMFDITVNRGMKDNIVNIFINTQTADGKQFFQTHQKELFTSLNQSGLQVSEFKLENTSSSFENSDSGSSKQFSHQSFSEKHFGSEQNQRKQESERRDELWKILREQEAA